jgi:hypothetical protein
MRKIGSGLMDQCSFAFRVIDQDWNSDRTVRTIKEVSLDRGDGSVVNYGASLTTSVDARARAKGGEKSQSDQARTRATALRGRGHLSDNANFAYYQAQTWALGVHEHPEWKTRDVSRSQGRPRQQSGD